jgi:hypothetical protein
MKSIIESKFLIMTNEEAIKEVQKGGHKNIKRGI